MPVLIPVPPEKTLQPPPKPATVFDITAFGADPTMTRDSWPAIRSAIVAADTAGPGSVVWTPPGNYLVGGPPNPHTVWLTEPGVNPIHFRGPGRSLARWVGMNPVGHVLLHLGVPGSRIAHMSVDTAAYDGGSALGMSKGTTFQGIGACTGQTFGVRFISGTVAVHGPGAIGDDLYLDDGAQPQLGAGANGTIGWTAGMDIDYNDGFTLTNVEHIGSYLAVYYDGQSSSPLGLIENYDYTPGVRANPTIWRGIFLTQCDNVTVRKLTLHDNSAGSSGVRVSHGVSNQNVTLDQINGGKLTIGDVLNLLVENSNVGDVHFDPLTEAQGAFVGTVHGLVTGLGPKVQVTGL